MKYIILDMEWNQAIKKLRFHLEGEIIQMGAVKLDESFHKIDTFKIGIAPKYYKKMHWAVAELTQIRESDFAYGFSFPTAIRYFIDWCGDDFILLTWGTDDIRLLKANLRLHKLSDDWIPAAYDLQRIFDHQIAHENRQCSLLYAMEKIEKTPLEAHDALHDALNTYEVCRSLDMIQAFREYESYGGKQISACCPKLTEYICPPDIFPSKTAAIKATVAKTIVCPCCGETMLLIEWVLQNDSKIITLAKCRCGKEYFIRMKLKKARPCGYTAPLVFYELDKPLTDYYLIKRLRKLPRLAKRHLYRPLLTCSISRG